jgi:hypothetical protein
MPLPESSGRNQARPVAPVSVTIGGVAVAATDIAYAGAAPQNVAGLLQVTVKVPSNAPSGSVPVVVTIGSKSSQNGVTGGAVGNCGGSGLPSVLGAYVHKLGVNRCRIVIDFPLEIPLEIEWSRAAADERSAQNCYSVPANRDTL